MPVLALAPFLIATLPLAAAPPSRVEIPPDHYTKAELTGFRSTSSYDETIDFLLRLTRTSPYLRLDWYGTSAEGRRMPVVVVSKDRAFSSAEADKVRLTATKPVVLILNGIHAGEIDGKDACLQILRDLALGNRPELLEALTLVIVPIYNVDGHERVSRWNRPNQDGPVDGMGFRTTTKGLDLNRDFVKADAPETRALLSLARDFRPDLFVDDHVTDGADFQATFTWSYAGEPVASPPILAWLRKAVGAALRTIEGEGIRTAPYVDWADPADPAKGIDPGPSQPRYATGYFPLRHVPSVLVELHALKPYAERVRANERFLTALLSETIGRAKDLLAARDASRAAMRRGAVGTDVPVELETDRSRSTPVDFPAYVWRDEVSFVTGKPVVRYDPEKPVTVPMPFYEFAKVKRSVPRAAGYLVPAGWPGVEERLALHGIRYERLPEERTLQVGTYRASNPAFAASTYQNRTRVTATIERRTETRRLPKGSLWIPLDTELALVATHLLDPESPDSLFAWGEFSSIFETKEYADPRVLDAWAPKKLAEDPKTAAAWKAKLEDPKFAGDARARYRFWYERSPWFDELGDLVPVYRLEKPLETLPVSPAVSAAAAARE